MQLCFRENDLGSNAITSKFSTRSLTSSDDVTFIPGVSVSFPLLYQNNWDNQFTRRKGLFGSKLWVSVHSLLALLLVGLKWGTTPWWELLVEFSHSLQGQCTKEEGAAVLPLAPLPKLVLPMTWRPFTDPPSQGFHHLPIAPS